MADVLLGGIVINEILVDPNGASNFDTDGNGTAASTDEYIELYNSSGSAIDISGLELWDQGVGEWFTFPPGTILQPGGHAMVMAGVQTGGALPTGGPNDLFFDAGRGSPLINNGGDNVTVYDPSNDEFIQATFNGDSLDDPTTYTGFSGTATRVGSGEGFGNDTDGESLQRTGDGTNTFGSDAPTPGTTNVCFADGSLIATPQGEVLVEKLKVGDLVLTADHGPQPVTWLYARSWSAADIAQFPNLAAVLIRAGSLGGGMPKTDLRLSQQHRVLVRGPVAVRMFDCDEVLIPAKALLELEGVALDIPNSDVTYFHVMLDQHQVIFSNGVPAESLFLGPQTLAAVSQDALDEICMLLDLTKAQLQAASCQIEPARKLVKGRKAKRLVERHAKNGHPVAFL